MYRRILAIDSNQQQIVALSEEGVRISTLHIGSQFNAYWPHQLRCFARASANNQSLPTVDVYLSGYLGKEKSSFFRCRVCSNNAFIYLVVGQLWKFTLERSTQDGSFNFE